MNIEGLNILVTGGASGIGLAFVKRLCERGARVWAIDRDRQALDQVAEDTSRHEASLQWLECDVSKEHDVLATVDFVESRSGGIDVLINNAAILLDQTLVSKLGKKIKKHSLADWESTLGSNLTGTFLMAREVAEKMILARRSGLIVNLSSISRHGNPGQSAYAASKAAVDALTVTWSQELAPYHIRVVAIAPGFVETRMTQRIPDMFLDRIREKTPLKRFGTLEEFARTIEFVIENDYLNGKTLEVDGGLRF
ncbi:MAG: SDR family oxidoreductase [Planctomycetales bacterium]|nr:SDR family oxidoreductase [Planctomycetales bacterium]